jgi:mono/diheme cytochrome c family protein
MKAAVSIASTLVVAIAGGALLLAQNAPKKSLWDGVYTAEQASRGGVTYSANCVQCHGPDLMGDARYKALVGDTFWSYFQGRNVDFMLDFVSKNMPNNAPGSLDTDKYQDLVAFILSKNEVPAGMAPLTMAAISGVALAPKGGPIQADLPDKTAARVVGCLAKGGASGWVVNKASSPARADDKDAIASEKTRALGDRSIPLLFVLTPLDKMVGHRVWARGVLAGAGGANGLNVTEVGDLGDSCE